VDLSNHSTPTRSESQALQGLYYQLLLLGLSNLFEYTLEMLCCS